MFNVNEAEVVKIPNINGLLKISRGLRKSKGTQYPEYTGSPQLMRENFRILSSPSNVHHEERDENSTQSDATQVYHENDVITARSHGTRPPFSRAAAAEEDNTDSRPVGCISPGNAAPVYQRNSSKRQPIDNIGGERLEKRQRIPEQFSSMQVLSTRSVDSPADDARQDSMIPEIALVNSISPPPQTSDDGIFSSNIGPQFPDSQTLQPFISNGQLSIDPFVDGIEAIKHGKSRNRQLGSEINQLTSEITDLGTRIQAMQKDLESARCNLVQKQEERRQETLRCTELRRILTRQFAEIISEDT